jgi:aspartate-semialdehyde dehydrogenase
VRDLFSFREPGETLFPQQIAFSRPAPGEPFMENGYTEEEMTICRETQRILGERNLRISATSV